MKTILKEKEVVNVTPKFPGLYKYIPNGSIWLMTDARTGTCLMRSPEGLGEPVGCHCSSLAEVGSTWCRQDTWRYLDPTEETVTLSND